MTEPVRLPVGRGLFALVDAADIKRVSGLAWHATGKQSAPGVFYVQHSLRVGQGRKGRKDSVSLHRFIMGCERGDGKIVDHRNGNPLDNRRTNLRVTDARGNATNVTSSKLQKRGGFKGVSWSPAAKKWQASICAGPVRPNGKRKQIYIGIFIEAAAAAHAYDIAAIRHFGAFAKLNFPLIPESAWRPDPAWWGPQPPPSVASDFSAAIGLGGIGGEQ